MPHFLLKLIPPRPSFAQDMTEAEAATMQEHGAHLARLLESGQGIAFGPVLDPQGVWGLGIIEAADEAAAREVTERDPVVVAGVGRYEIYPMQLMGRD